MLMGNKVLLRPIRRSDLVSFLKWFNDREVTQYLSIYIPMTEMAEEKFIDGLGNNNGTDVQFIIEAVEDDKNKPIGTIALHAISPKDHFAAFGIVIGEKDYWGKGHGTEAARLMTKCGFEQLNLHRIYSNVYSFNERSIRMHKSVGFKEEGRERQKAFINGQYYDDIFFGLLRNEWRGL